MKTSTILVIVLCACLVLAVLAALTAAVAAYWWLTPADGHSFSSATRSSTGSLGRYVFQSKDEVTAFNAKVSKWFLEQGFVPDSEAAFHAVARGDNWDKPGQLLCQRYDAANHVYVFIPECYHPENNTQIIGFHIALRGSGDEVRRRNVDFDDLGRRFREQFPTMPYDP